MESEKDKGLYVLVLSLVYKISWSCFQHVKVPDKHSEHIPPNNGTGQIKRKETQKGKTEKNPTNHTSL